MRRAASTARLKKKTRAPGAFHSVTAARGLLSVDITATAQAYPRVTQRKQSESIGARQLARVRGPFARLFLHPLR
eukprot:scaffold3250_cov222-Pinguiococcus_pyrenoidosus.AAC.5